MAEQTHVGMRLAALGFVAVLIQVTVLSQLRVLGGETDLSPLVVAAAGLLLGAVPGAVFGFGIGMFVDLAFAQTLGVSALIFCLVGYGAGDRAEQQAGRGDDQRREVRFTAEDAQLREHRDLDQHGDEAERGEAHPDMRLLGHQWGSLVRIWTESIAPRSVAGVIVMKPPGSTTEGTLVTVPIGMFGGKMLA